ncbi:HEAT repeat domain-containing protein [Planctomyces sp. SH-PL62]|uniref:HEAT repeat domain-containing protein n=1 Tax=Planctomyces sp. SH-PL62 TaxID=1636152 RepID=UPI00078D8BCC|nr:HEAT repeat domain-containing protein [Planctomyces sp. SH-PL62]AMV39446.1 putative lyase [Planctomyces sp. SH-PL62]
MSTYRFFLLAVVATPLAAQASERTYEGRPIYAWILDIGSEDFDIQDRASMTLRRVGPEAAASLPEIVALLDDQSGPVRAAAAEVLGRMGPAAKAAAPPLIKALRSVRIDRRNVGFERLEDPLFVFRVVRSLGRIGPEAAGTTAALIDAIGPLKSDQEILKEVFFAIAKLEPEPLPILIAKGLKHEDLMVKAACLEFLGWLGEEAAPALPSLLELYQEQGEFAEALRISLGEALGSIGPAAKAALPLLAREGDVAALLRIAPEDPLTLQTVRERLESRDEQLRLPAALALARFDPMSQSALSILGERFPVMAAPPADRALMDLTSLPPILAEIDRDGRVAIPALVNALRSNDGNTRAEAIVALGSFGPRGKEVVPTLVALLKDEAEYIRRDAAWALGSIGPDARAAIPDLIAATKDEGSDVRKMACKSLAKIDRDGETSLPALRRAMQDENPWVRDDATFVIGSLGEKARPAAPELRAMMKEHKSVAAAYSLCRIGENVPEDLETLIGFIPRHDSAEQSLLAPVVLARLGPQAQAATPALIKELESHRSPEELLWDESSVMALGRIGPQAKAAVPILKARMQDQDGPLRDWCAIALSRIDPDAENAFPTPDALLDREARHRRRIARLEATQYTLIAALGGIHDVPEGGRESVLLMLGNLGPQSNQYPTFPMYVGCRVDEALVLAVTCWAAARTNPGTGASVPLLIETLKHEDAFVRTTAAYALGGLGTSAKAAAPALRNAQADPERSVRDWSKRALERITP